jgi:hypothetical protein
LTTSFWAFGLKFVVYPKKKKNLGVLGCMFDKSLKDGDDASHRNRSHSQSKIIKRRIFKINCEKIKEAYLISR